MATLSAVLDIGRNETNGIWPRRDKSSDGWIGDTTHAASGYPKTKHMPNPRGYVHAWDVDPDGIDITLVLARFMAQPNAHLWIWQRQIAFRAEGWRPRKYTGTADPHTTHGHLEDDDDAAAEHDGRAWNIHPGTPTRPPVPPSVGRISALPVVRRNPDVSTAATRLAQLAVRAAGYSIGPSGVDGRIGDDTVAAVRAFQHAHTLTPDGIIGPKTWTALAQALLVKAGLAITVDGGYGPRTTAATVAFQRTRGLTADGIFGPKTWAAALS